MALDIPPGFGLAAYTYTGSPGTQPFVTTMGHAIPEDPAEWQQAADDLFGIWQSTMNSLVSDNLTFDRVTLAIGTSGPGGSIDSTNPPAAGGTSGTNWEPTAMACILRKSTAQFGRFGRGRMFLPGMLSDAHVEQDGTIVSARRDAIHTMALDWWESLTAPVSGFAYYPVLFHSESLGIPPSTLTGLTPSDTVGWIRGRIR